MQKEATREGESSWRSNLNERIADLEKSFINDIDEVAEQCIVAQKSAEAEEIK